MASQLAVVLLAKTTVPTPSGQENAAALCESFGQLTLVEGDVVRRVAQLVGAINDNLRILWNRWKREQIRVSVNEVPTEPNIEEVRQEGIGNCIVIRWVSDEGVR